MCRTEGQAAEVRPQKQSEWETTCLCFYQHEKSPIVSSSLGHKLKVQVMGGGIQLAIPKSSPQPERREREDIPFLAPLMGSGVLLPPDLFQVTEVFICQEALTTVTPSFGL